VTLQLFWYAAAALLVILGIVGTVLPVLPGALLVFAGLLLAAWAGGFAHVGWVGLAVIGTLGLLSLAVDFAASILGARRVGASPLALAGATVGALVGIFFGLAGVVFGPFVGAVLGELAARRDLLQAGKVGLGTWLGLAVAAIAKLVIALAMIAVFVAVYAFNP
jgi:uncharacterized protein YqgC (DUF456 family)